MSFGTRLGNLQPTFGSIFPTVATTANHFATTEQAIQNYFLKNCPVGLFLYRQSAGVSIIVRESDSYPKQRNAKMTNFQKSLIEKITAKNPEKFFADRASFNGRFLNCEADIKHGSKVKKQRFSFVFDSPEDCQGCKLAGRPNGTYAEHFAKDVFAAIVELSDEIAKA